MREMFIKFITFAGYMLAGAATYELVVWFWRFMKPVIHAWTA